MEVSGRCYPARVRGSTITLLPSAILLVTLSLASLVSCGDDAGSTRGESDGASSLTQSTAVTTASSSDAASASETLTGGDSESMTGDSTASSSSSSGASGSTVGVSDSDASACGDGVVSGDEACDDGDANGSYGACADDCGGPGPRCGDGVLQADEGEACDDGDAIDNNACSNACQDVPCEEQDGAPGLVLSYIWIANDGEATVSKINTMSVVEEGRYRVIGARPSRTSVNLNGDVAVSSRDPGGVTKVAASVERCVDKNNNGEIETSSGPGDVLPLEADECVLWTRSIPSPNYNNGPRATAWVAEKPDPESCEYPEPRLWIAWRDSDKNAHFELLDGEDGGLLEEVLYPFPDTGGGAKNPYGGAVDQDGNFYVAGIHNQDVLKVDIETLEVTDLGDANGDDDRYGMTLDGDGDLWAAGYGGELYRWRSADATWITYPGAHVNLRGIAVDASGSVWAASEDPCGLVHFDKNSESWVNQDIPLADCVDPWGVAVDHEGFVWVVDKGDKAYKLNPQSYAIVGLATGLADPYTYSDMTGAVLKLQIPG